MNIITRTLTLLSDLYYGGGGGNVYYYNICITREALALDILTIITIIFDIISVPLITTGLYITFK